MTRNPPAPSGLISEAQRYWKIVNQNWVLNDDDLEILRQAVFALNTVYLAREQVEKEGLTYKTGSSLRQHPAIQLELKAREQFLRAVKQLQLIDENDKRSPGRPPEGW